MLVDVPKIEVEISYGGQSIIAKSNDVLNYRRAKPDLSDSMLTAVGRDKPEYAFSGARYKSRISAGIGSVNVRRTYVFRGATKVSHWISIR